MLFHNKEYDPTDERKLINKIKLNGVQFYYVKLCLFWTVFFFFFFGEKIPDGSLYVLDCNLQIRIVIVIRRGILRNTSKQD